MLSPFCCDLAKGGAIGICTGAIAVICADDSSKDRSFVYVDGIVDPFWVKGESSDLIAKWAACLLIDMDADELAEDEEGETDD